jgi:hypothetical protein
MRFFYSAIATYKRTAERHYALRENFPQIGQRRKKQRQSFSNLRLQRLQKKSISLDPLRKNTVFVRVEGLSTPMGWRPPTSDFAFAGK